MITNQQSGDLLRPWLGSEFVNDNRDLFIRLTIRMNSCCLERDSLLKMVSELDNDLFLHVRDKTRGKMVIKLDDGRLMRLQVRDFSLMADELMYLVFQNLEINEDHLKLVRDYSMRTSSLSALRALYERFAGLESDEDLYALRRVITSCHPPFRWRQWLQ